MLPVRTAAEARRVDRRAVGELHVPGAVLMENAGRGAADLIVASLARLGLPRRGARVAVVCGKGGNGGDGFVAARRLRRAGARAAVFLAFPADEIGGDAAAKYRELRRAGIRPRLVEDDASLAAALRASDLD
ncbi:MAG TPA: NAD(P)H-hydrate epimerase, partial [Methylomirabilota bacterium]|nr:NAD(P)H-hydrate epimerase [Methylomirabilota bacterium]